MITLAWFRTKVSRHPTADWLVQQLRETFPQAGPYRYVILDRDSKFDTHVITFLKATGLKLKRQAFNRLGKMEPQNAGWEVVAGRSWTVSSRWTNDICFRDLLGQTIRHAVETVVDRQVIVNVDGPIS